MPTSKSAHWYFDYISPYAYLQCEAGLPKLEGTVDLTPVPLVFGGLLDFWGQKGPAEIPPKRRHTYRQIVWLAAANGVPLRFPDAHPFNPLGLLRLTLAAGNSWEVIRTIFRFVWGEGGNPADPAQLSALAARFGISDVAAATADPAVKAQLLANGRQAQAAGIFGVPTIAFADGELFWGHDMTDAALAYAQGAPIFSGADMLKVSDLPMGKQRKAAA